VYIVLYVHSTVFSVMALCDKQIVVAIKHQFSQNGRVRTLNGGPEVSW